MPAHKTQQTRFGLSHAKRTLVTCLKLQMQILQHVCTMGLTRCPSLEEHVTRTLLMRALPQMQSIDNKAIRTWAESAQKNTLCSCKI
jgi:hypothetical protein